METIVKAKDQQAAEANKNASILLKELDLEKVITDCNPVLLMGEGCQILNAFDNDKCDLWLWLTVPGGEQEAGPGC